MNFKSDAATFEEYFEDICSDIRLNFPSCVISQINRDMISVSFGEVLFHINTYKESAGGLSCFFSEISEKIPLFVFKHLDKFAVSKMKEYETKHFLIRYLDLKEILLAEGFGVTQ